LTYKYSMAILAAFLCLAAAPASAAEALPLVPHKSLYNLRLATLGTAAGVTDVKGQMFYEQDDTCDAWTTDHRFTMKYYYPEQRPSMNTSHYISYESKDGQQFHFNSERQQGGEPVEQLRGALVLLPDGAAKAEYSRPPELSFDLPRGYLLPTSHTAEIIRHAKNGDAFFKSVIFDGTDAEGPIEVNAFIGKKLTAAEIAGIAAQSPKIDKSLLSENAWHVRMAVFPLKTQEMMPAYEMEMSLHDNGVVSRVLVDYKSFSVEQVLEALEKLPARKCAG